MNNSTLVKIIMPSQTIFKADSTMVNIPGGSGMFGVLPGHVKLISTIQVGVIVVYTQGDEKKFFVYGGMAQVSASEVNIVTEFAVSLEGQNKPDILNKISELKSELEISITNSLEAQILDATINKYNALLPFIV